MSIVKKINDITTNNDIVVNLIRLKTDYTVNRNWYKEDKNWEVCENKMKSLVGGFEFIKGLKRPFGFQIKIDNKKVKVFVKNIRNENKVYGAIIN